MFVKVFTPVNVQVDGPDDIFGAHRTVITKPSPELAGFGDHGREFE
jgi:hypothetical protein